MRLLDEEPDNIQATIRMFLEERSPMTCEGYDKVTDALIQTVFILGTLSCGLYCAWRIYLARHSMNVRQRAPLVAIIQILMLSFYVVFQAGVDFSLHRGWFDAWITNPPNSVPISRYLYKFCRLGLRLSVGYLAWYRAFVIWGYWKRRETYTGFKATVVKVLTKKSSMIAGLFLGLALWTFLFYGPTGWYLESAVTAATWYNPKYHNFYKVFNSTYARIMETIVFVQVAWLARSFPNRLSIRNEMLLIFSLNFFLNQLLELKVIAKKLHYCTPIGLKTDFVITCLMLLILSLSLRWFCRHQRVQMPPPSRPANLHEFLKVPQYRHQFRRFVKFKGGRERLAKLNQLIKTEYMQYINESRNKTNSTNLNFRLLRHHDMASSFDPSDFGGVKKKSATQKSEFDTDLHSFQVTYISLLQQSHSGDQKSRFHTGVQDLSGTDEANKSQEKTFPEDKLKESGGSLEVEQLPDYAAEFRHDYYEYLGTVSFKTVRLMIEEDAKVFYLGVDNI